MKVKNTLLAVSLAAVFSVSSARAAIIFTLDTVAKTFDVSGTIVGTPTTSPTLMLFSNSSSGSFIAFDSVDLISYISSAPNNTTGANIQVYQHSVSSEVRVVFGWPPSSLPEQTLTANGTEISYASFDPGVMGVFEALASANTILPVSSGTSSDFVQLAAVPEPSSYAVLAGLGALWLVALRRLKL